MERTCLRLWQNYMENQRLLPVAQVDKCQCVAVKSEFCWGFKSLFDGQLSYLPVVMSELLGRGLVKYRMDCGCLLSQSFADNDLREHGRKSLRQYRVWDLFSVTYFMIRSFWWIGTIHSVNSLLINWLNCEWKNWKELWDQEWWKDLNSGSGPMSLSGNSIACPLFWTGSFWELSIGSKLTVFLICSFVSGGLISPVLPLEKDRWMCWLCWYRPWVKWSMWFWMSLIPHDLQK